jgi:hypothetical protein
VPGASSFPDIFITELQAFSVTPVGDVKNKITRSSRFYDFNARVRLLDRPILYYELIYTAAKTGSAMKSTLSNGLVGAHRFSDIFSSQARVSVEKNEDPLEKGTAYVYSASLLAVPLRTLSHTLTFSGRFENLSGQNSDRNSIYLYNVAELYRGINLNLNGGIDFVKRETGQKETDTLLSIGLNVIPRHDLSMNFTYTDTVSQPSGGNGDIAVTKRYTRRTDFIVAYNPFTTIYLFADIGYILQESGSRSLRNMGLNWSPFQDGMLLFNFTYNTDFDSQQNNTVRTIKPSMRLKLSRKSYLDISYLSVTSKSDLQHEDSKIASANLRVAF